MLHTGPRWRKAGRPKLPDHQKRTVINLSIPAHTLARLDRAMIKGKYGTRQFFIRMIIEKELATWEPRA